MTPLMPDCSLCPFCAGRVGRCPRHAEAQRLVYATALRLARTHEVVATAEEPRYPFGGVAVSLHEVGGFALTPPVRHVFSHRDGAAVDEDIAVVAAPRAVLGVGLALATLVDHAPVYCRSWALQGFAVAPEAVLVAVATMVDRWRSEGLADACRAIIVEARRLGVTRRPAKLAEVDPVAPRTLAEVALGGGTPAALRARVAMERLRASRAFV